MYRLGADVGWGSIVLPSVWCLLVTGGVGGVWLASRAQASSGTGACLVTGSCLPVLVGRKN